MNTSLSTRRLLIAPLGLDDAELSVELWTDPLVVKYICDVPTEEEIRSDMPDTIRRGAGGTMGIWSVSSRATGEKIGSTYLLPMPTDDDDVDYNLLDIERMPDGDIELGYFFKPSAWGFGYAGEVSQRMLRFAFQDAGLNEVVASVHEENIASRRVLEKSGFIHAGSAMCWGRIGPIYKISRDRWNDVSV